MTTEPAILLANNVLDRTSATEAGARPELQLEIVRARTQDSGLTLLFSELLDYQVDIPLQLVVAAAFNFAEKFKTKFRVTVASGSKLPPALWTLAKIYRSKEVNPIQQFLRKSSEQRHLPFAVSHEETFVVVDAALLPFLLQVCNSHQIILMIQAEECREGFLEKVASIPSATLEQLRYITCGNDDVLSQLNLNPSQVYKMDYESAEEISHYFQAPHLNTAALENFFRPSI